jgi:hypothetical protein
MKKIMLVVLGLLGFTILNAQDILLKNSPFHFVDATFNLSIEKELDGNKSVNYSGGIHLTENGWNYEDEIGLTAEIQLRKYVLKFKNSESNLNGIYVSPFGMLSYFKMNHTYRDWRYEYDDLGNYIASWDEEISVTASSKFGQAGIVMGVQYVMSNVLVFDFFLGGGIQYSVEAGNRRSTNYDARFYTGVIPKIGFNFGVKL